MFFRSSLTASVLRRQLATERSAVLRVRGRSMTPLVPEGSRVRLRSVARNESLRGAVVAVDTGSYVAVHRVTRARANLVRTQGIARATPDPEWSTGDVIGVACSVASPGGAWRIGSERRLRTLGTLAAAGARMYRAMRAPFLRRPR